MKDYTILGNAIVAQAVEDYRHFLLVLVSGDPKDADEAKREIDSLEKFFFSEWYSILTKVDPTYILCRLKREVDYPL